MTSFEKAMLKPSDCFRSPRDVLKEAWSPGRKFDVLRQWKYDIGQQNVATEENLPPSPDAREVSIDSIHKAMTELGYDPESAPVPSKGA